MRCLVVLSLVIAGGCRDPELQQLQEIRDEVCACKTASCGEQALQRVPKREGSNEPRALSSSRRSQDLAREMMDCMARLYLAERPTTDPDAEEPAPAP